MLLPVIITSVEIMRKQRRCSSKTHFPLVICVLIVIAVRQPPSIRILDQPGLDTVMLSLWKESMTKLWQPIVRPRECFQGKVLDFLPVKLSDFPVKLPHSSLMHWDGVSARK